MSSENNNRYNSPESEEDDCCDNEGTESNIQHSTAKHMDKSRVLFILLLEAGPKCQNSLQFFELFIALGIAELISRKTNQYAQLI